MAHVHRTAPGPHHPNRTTFRAPAHPRVASREAIHLRRGPFMNGLLSQLVVNGIGIAAAPWCIIGVILILSASSGLRKAVAFLLGASTAMVAIYAVCSAAVGHFALASSSSASSGV